MTRISFVFTLVLSLLAAPLAAEAQQAGRVYRIGFLSGAASPLPNHRGFHEGLRALGWHDGQNLVIEYRWAAGRYERMAEMAADLVRLEADVLFAAGGTSATQALSEATKTIPIVTVMGDIVGAGFAESLARPGGNITGLSLILPELSGKQLELLKAILPRLSRVATLHNPGTTSRLPYVRETEVGARALGLSLQTLAVHDPSDFEKAFSAMVRKRTEAVLVHADAMFNAQRAQIAELAIKYRLPAIYPDRVYADAGGLVSYGPSLTDLFRRAASYVDKILKGAKPAELPIEQPMAFELVINLKTAKALGLTIPPSVLVRADKLIE